MHSPRSWQGPPRLFGSPSGTPVFLVLSIYLTPGDYIVHTPAQNKFFGPPHDVLKSIRMFKKYATKSETPWFHKNKKKEKTYNPKLLSFMQGYVFAKFYDGGGAAVNGRWGKK